MFEDYDQQQEDQKRKEESLANMKRMGSQATSGTFADKFAHASSASQSSTQHQTHTFQQHQTTHKPMEEMRHKIEEKKPSVTLPKVSKADQLADALISRCKEYLHEKEYTDLIRDIRNITNQEQARRLYKKEIAPRIKLLSKGDELFNPTKGISPEKIESWARLKNEATGYSGYYAQLKKLGLIGEKA